jgi:mono/diheme cytochrome c family protein
MPNLPNTIRAHAFFLAAASLLSLQACGGPGQAAPAAPAAATASPPAVAAASPVEAGRYLVEIGGCNDCHTPGFPESNGMQPADEADWLMGSPVGYSGPWGVSYAPNLRLSFQTMEEQDFIDMARAAQGRPPMPWPSLRAMSDGDLKAIYAYIRHLGPKGEMMPAPLSPGVAPTTPHIPFMPVMPG